MWDFFCIFAASLTCSFLRVKGNMPCERRGEVEEEKTNEEDSVACSFLCIKKEHAKRMIVPSCPLTALPPAKQPKASAWRNYLKCTKS